MLQIWHHPKEIYDLRIIAGTAECAERLNPPHPAKDGKACETTRGPLGSRLSFAYRPGAFHRAHQKNRIFFSTLDIFGVFFSLEKKLRFLTILEPIWEQFWSRNRQTNQILEYFSSTRFWRPILEGQKCEI